MARETIPPPLRGLLEVAQVPGSVAVVRARGRWVPVLLEDLARDTNVILVLDGRYDPLGAAESAQTTASTALDGHVAAADPHPGYVSTAEGAALQGAAEATAAAALAAHAASASPHALPAVKPTGYGIQIWNKISAGLPTTVSFIANQLTADLCIERWGRTYTAAVIQVSTAVAATSGRLALYSWDGVAPEALLWTSASVDTTTTGIKTPTFAAGTWTTAGNVYKDGSGNFKPPVGTAFCLAWVAQGGGPTVIGVANTEHAAHGTSTTTLFAAQCVGWSVGSVSGALPDPFGTPAIVTTGMPMYGLVY